MTNQNQESTLEAEVNEQGTVLVLLIKLVGDMATNLQKRFDAIDRRLKIWEDKVLFDEVNVGTDVLYNEPKTSELILAAHREWTELMDEGINDPELDDSRPV